MVKRKGRKTRRLKRKYKRLMRVISIIVTFCTVYWLILPAITMTRSYHCNLTEHHHTRECYSTWEDLGVESISGKLEQDPSDQSLDHDLAGLPETEAASDHANLNPGSDSNSDLFGTGTEQTDPTNAADSDEGIYYHKRQVFDMTARSIARDSGSYANASADPSVEVTNSTADTLILTCGMVEHTHTEECRSDKEADVESQQDWESKLPDITGLSINEAIAVLAESQIGYEESKDNFECDGEDKHHGWTRYGAYKGKPYTSWRSAFADFILHYAGVEEVEIPKKQELLKGWIEEQNLWQQWVEASDMLVRGDLVFFADPKSQNQEIRYGFIADPDSLTIVIPDRSGKVAKEKGNITLDDIRGLIRYQDETVDDSSGNTNNAGENPEDPDDPGKIDQTSNEGADGTDYKHTGDVVSETEGNSDSVTIKDENAADEDSAIQIGQEQDLGSENFKDTQNHDLDSEDSENKHNPENDEIQAVETTDPAESNDDTDPTYTGPTDTTHTDTDSVDKENDKSYGSDTNKPNQPNTSILQAIESQEGDSSQGDNELKETPNPDSETADLSNPSENLNKRKPIHNAQKENEADVEQAETGLENKDPGQNLGVDENADEKENDIEEELDPSTNLKNNPSEDGNSLESIIARINQLPELNEVKILFADWMNLNGLPLKEEDLQEINRVKSEKKVSFHSERNSDSNPQDDRVSAEDKGLFIEDNRNEMTGMPAKADLNEMTDPLTGHELDDEMTDSVTDAGSNENSGSLQDNIQNEPEDSGPTEYTDYPTLKRQINELYRDVSSLEEEEISSIPNSFKLNELYIWIHEMDQKYFNNRTLCADKGSYSVQVSYTSGANIPDGTVLQTYELINDPDHHQDEYNQYLQQSLEAANTSSFEKIRIFEISLVYQGEEIQPNDFVSVSLNLNEDSDWLKDENLVVVHCHEGETELIDPTAVTQNTLVVDLSGFSDLAAGVLTAGPSQDWNVSDDVINALGGKLDETQGSNAIITDNSSKGISMKFFDYWVTDDPTPSTYANGNGGINNGHTLDFRTNVKKYKDDGVPVVDASASNAGSESIKNIDRNYLINTSSSDVIAIENRKATKQSTMLVSLGLLAKTLENGFPSLIDFRKINNQVEPTQFVAGTPWPPNSSEKQESLDYLFNDFDAYSEVNDKIMGKKCYGEINGLLSSMNSSGKRDINGKYIGYDSSINFAHYNGKDIDLYNKTFTWYKKSGGEYFNSHFFPFSNLESERIISAIGVVSNDEPENKKVSSEENGYKKLNYLLPDLNHYFGMMMTVDFYQPEEGKVDGEDMIFKFSGDDDVLIYIDGVLVGDVAGSHNKADLTINFSTGAIAYGLNYTYTQNGIGQSGYNFNPVFDKESRNVGTTIKQCFEIAGKANETSWKGNTNTFGDDTVHELKMFYLERGHNESNLKLLFNLAVQPFTLEKEVKVVGPNGKEMDVPNILKNMEFEFKISFKADSTTYMKLEDKKYKLYNKWSGGTYEPEGLEKSLEFQNDDKTIGIVKLNPNQMIRFTDLGVPESYEICEVTPYKGDDVYELFRVDITPKPSGENVELVPNEYSLKHDINGKASLEVKYTNVYRFNGVELPETGGSGTLPYISTGLTLIAGSVAIGLYRRSRTLQK